MQRIFESLRPLVENSDLAPVVAVVVSIASSGESFVVDHLHSLLSERSMHLADSALDRCHSTIHGIERPFKRINLIILSITLASESTHLIDEITHPWILSLAPRYQYTMVSPCS